MEFWKILHIRKNKINFKCWFKSSLLCRLKNKVHNIGLQSLHHGVEQFSFERISLCDIHQEPFKKLGFFVWGGGNLLLISPVCFQFLPLFPLFPSYYCWNSGERAISPEYAPKTFKSFRWKEFFPTKNQKIIHGTPWGLSRRRSRSAASPRSHSTRWGWRGGQ